MHFLQRSGIWIAGSDYFYYYFNILVTTGKEHKHVALGWQVVIRIKPLCYSFNSHFDQCKSVRIWTKFTDSQLGKQGLAIFLIVGEDRDEEDGISSKDGVKMTLVRLGKLYTKDDTMSKSQVFVTTCKMSNSIFTTNSSHSFVFKIYANIHGQINYRD